MNVKRTLAAAAAAALTLAGAASATPSPAVSAITATGTETSALGTTVHRQELTVTWTLGDAEYVCSIRVGGPEGERVDPLEPRQSSWTGAIGATPGNAIGITIQYVTIPAGVTVRPEDACYRPRSSASTTATAATWTPPAPPAEPTAEPSSGTSDDATATETATTTTTPTTVEQRVTELERMLADLANRVEAVRSASLAAWTALVDQLAAGATPDVAALAARSAYLNATYGLG